jgi:futalosine hydrolase
MDSTKENLIIAVAHPSEQETVENAVKRSGSQAEIILTGVGGAAMSWALQKRFSSGPLPLLIVNAGIAGSYVTDLRPGDICVTGSDCFADMGVDDNGSFTSVFNASLADPDTWPFSGGRIHCSGKWFEIIGRKYRVVRAATVNMSSGSQPVIDRIMKSWDPQIETMEGAWFAYTCTMSHTQWLAVRAVSNIVEPRNIKKWDIPLALMNLEVAMTDILEILKER